MKPKFPLRLVHSASSLVFSATLATVTLAFSSISAQGQSLYWDVDGTTPGFSTVVGGWDGAATSWNPDVAGASGAVTAATTSGNDLIIPQATTNTGSITVTGSQLASSITFAANVGPTTITGGTGITIGGTGAFSGIFQQSSGANTVSSPLTLNPANTAFGFSNSAAGLLTIGAVTGSAGSGTQTVTIGSSAAGGIALDGVIGNGVAGGNVALAVNNTSTASTGITTLSGANTYSGGTVITAGLLRFATTASMTSGGTIAVGTGAGLIVDVGGVGEFTNATSGSGTFGGILSGLGAGGNTVTYSGAVTVGIDVGSSTGVTYAGVIANPAGSTSLSFYKINGQNLTLTGANTYSGKTILGAGGAVFAGSFGNIGDASSPLGANSTIEFRTGGNLSFIGTTVQTSNKVLDIAETSATIRADGTGVGAITLSANFSPSSSTNKTLSLFGANTNANTISGIISNGAAGVLNVVKNLAGTWVLSGSNTYTGGTAINGGSLVFRNLASKATTGTHAFAAGTTIGLGVGAGLFTTADVDNAFTGTMTGNLSNVTVNASTNIGIDSTAGSLTYATDIGAVTRGLTKFGTNTLTLSSTTSAYTGATTVAGGTLSVASLANAGSNSPIGAFPTPGATGLVLSGGSTFSYTGSTTTIDRGFTYNTGGVSTFNLPGTGVALILGATTIASTDNLNITGGAGSSLKIGPVTVTAAQANFNASIPTNVGNISFSASNVIGNRGTATVNFANITGTGTGTLFLAGGGSGPANFNGVVGGFSGLVSIGGVNLSVLGANTYTGATQIQSGAIFFNSIKNVGGGASSFGAPAIGNGTIQFGNGTNIIGLTYTGTGDTTDRVLNLRGTTGTVTLAQAGTGLLKFTSAFTATGLGSKTLVLSGSTAGTGELGGAIVDNSVTNTTALSKTGTGTWTLSGANLYTGGTTVTTGTLQFAKIDSMPAAGAVGVGTGATLAVNAGGSGEFTTATSGAGSIGGLLAGTGGQGAAVNYTGDVAVGIDTTNAAGPLTYSGVIPNVGGTLGLTKLGTGVLVLDQTNLYTGPTTVRAGSLALAAAGSITTSPSVSIAAGATLDTSLKPTYAVPAAQPIAFGIDATGAGTAGKIAAAALNITNATVTYNITGTPDDPVYVLATYTSLTGAAFLSAPTPPAGYTVDYAYQGNKIALVSGTPYGNWSGGALANIDTNADGVRNGVAWVLGAASPAATATTLVPTLDNTSDPNFLIFNYRRSDTAFADSNTAIKVEYCSDLVGWIPATAGPDITISPSNDFYAPGIDKVEVKIRRTLAVGGKLFTRLNVVVTP